MSSTALDSSSPWPAQQLAAKAPPLLSLQGVVKRYGQRVALKGLNLEIPAGQWVALLGPNGAGKSTLFSVLTGLFAADEGQVLVAGHNMASQASKALRALGVVFQQSALDLDLSVLRNLRFHANLQGLPAAVAKTQIEQGLASLGLTADQNRAVRELSGGNRRKVELARALLHQPALVLMDEPTVGLDPRSRRDLLAAIEHEVRHRHCAVLWATHLVQEAERAHRVLVLHQGQVLADGSPLAVAQALGGGTLEQAFLRATAATSLAPGKPVAAGPSGP